jgi:hypothetical protein
MRRHDTSFPESRFVSRFALMTRLKSCGQKFRDRSWHFNRSDSYYTARISSVLPRAFIAPAIPSIFEV